MFLANTHDPSQGASIPREGFWIPREGPAPREGRFVSIGEVHDQTTRVALNYWTRAFAELMDLLLELVRARGYRRQ